MFDSRLRSEELLKFEGYTDVQITILVFVLVAIGNIIGNSQTAKQMKELRFTYETKLERP